MLSLKQARELGVSYVLSELDLDSKNSKNKLYDPPSAAVQRLLKGKNIKVKLNQRDFCAIEGLFCVYFG